MAVTNNMHNDRRVARNMAALHEAGYAVKVVGHANSANNGAADNAQWLSLLRTRSQHGWRFYAQFNRGVYRWLLREKPHIVWANDTDTLLASTLAAKRLGAMLVLDQHELFAALPEIAHKPLVQAVWRCIERLCMPQCDALFTVCQSIATHYAQRLGVEMQVVRNMPDDAEPRAATLAPQYSSLLPTSGTMLLYQGCVNVGRGVDWAIDAVGLLGKAYTLVVAGGGDCLQQMQAYAAQKPWSAQVRFLGHVPPEQLTLITSRADVGLVMLEDRGQSYHYALPNRIGDFIAAEVPMVVSDLPEMAAVIRQHHVGCIMQAPGAQALAVAIKAVAERQWTSADFASAKADYCWAREKQTLVNATVLALHKHQMHKHNAKNNKQ